MYISIDEIISFFISKNLDNENIKNRILKFKDYIIEYNNKLFFNKKDIERIESELFCGFSYNRKYLHSVNIFDLEKIKRLNGENLNKKIDELLYNIKKNNVNEFKNILEKIKYKQYIILDTEFDKNFNLNEIALKSDKFEIFMKNEEIDINFIKKYLSEIEVIFIHGADNDRIILKKYGINIDDKIIDTAILIGKYYGESKKISLEYLVEKFGLNKYKNFHNALNDVRAVYSILKRLNII